MDKQMKARLQWVEMYEATGDAGLTCRRCGISRPTLRLWYRRWKELGVEGLASRSRRPKNSPNKKRDKKLNARILSMRKVRNLGARRIQSELFREDAVRISLATIHKLLSEAKVKPLQAPPRGKHTKRYSRPIPGERVQMDTCKIAKGIFQYTAVDDCTRCRVLRIYKRRTAKNTLDFIDAVIEELGFPIQRFQTDRGTEFFAYKVQERLQAYGIKFRPNKPGAPQLNGKVERSQKTDKVEFYALADLADPELSDRLAEWQFYYNWQRPHGSLNGKTPMQVAAELVDVTPMWEEVGQRYGPDQERLQYQNYQVDLEMRKLKECP